MISPPDQVVEYLDRLVRMFDALAEAHGVEKIKTIGDSYMAAAGSTAAPPSTPWRWAGSRWR